MHILPIHTPDYKEKGSPISEEKKSLTECTNQISL